MKSRICKDKSGVGGFFEDLPKLLFILFAVALFISSIITNYSAYSNYNEKSAMIDDCNAFVADIISWEEITPDRVGLFNISNLSGLAKGDWLAKFPAETLGFNYQIQFFDRSLYESRLTFGVVQTEQRPVGSDIYARTVPVLIKDYNGINRAAHLVVAIWR